MYNTENLNVLDIRVKLISCQHLPILLGYTFKGYVIKTVEVNIIKTFGTLFALFSTVFTFKQYASYLTIT